MKKLTKIAATVAVLALGVGALAACGNDKGDPKPSPEDDKITVTFYDGNTVLSTQKIESGEKAVRPATDPSKSGYDFVRWCGTPSYSVAFNFDTELYEDTSVFAGFRSQEADDHKWFIVGTSLYTDLFKEVGWWGKDHIDPDEIPQKNLLAKSSTQGNLFTVTADFYAGDKFQIINTEDGWDGQIGFGYLTPEKQTATGDAAKFVSGGGLGASAKTNDIQCAVSGNYTFSLYVDKDGKLTEVDYERNGDAPELAAEFDYYIKGKDITAWQNMLVPYTQFSTEDNSVYTLSIGMKADDDFMFLATVRGDTTGDIANLNGTSMALATDADTAAAITLPAGGANFKIASGVGTYEFTITEDGDERTLSAKKTAETLPEYDFYVKGNMNNDTSWEERYPMTKDEASGLYKLEIELKKDEQFAVTVAAKGDEEMTEVFGLNTKYANKKLMSNQIDADAWNFTALANDTFTIYVDPATMLVYVEGVNDTVTYTVGLWMGSGSDWAMSTEKCEIKTDAAALTGSVTIELEAGSGKSFGFRAERNGTQTGWANAANDFYTGCEGITGTGNLTCETSGTYKFDFTIDADGAITNVVATKVA